MRVSATSMPSAEVPEISPTTGKRTHESPCHCCRSASQPNLTHFARLGQGFKRQETGLCLSDFVEQAAAQLHHAIVARSRRP